MPLKDEQRTSIRMPGQWPPAACLSHPRCAPRRPKNPAPAFASAAGAPCPAQSRPPQPQSHRRLDVGSCHCLWAWERDIANRGRQDTPEEFCAPKSGPAGTGTRPDKQARRRNLRRPAVNFAQA